MYKCDDCWHVFDSPKRAYESDRGHVYMVEVCPVCKGSAFEYVDLCDRCGEYESESKMNNGFCPKCAAAVMEAYNKFAMGLTEVERDFLEESIRDRL